MTSLNDGSTPWQKSDYGKLALSFIPATILTWGIHEFAHWLMGTLLGYDMWISFNQAGLVEGSYSSVTHQVLVAMAGPFITWIQAVVALLFIRRSPRTWLYSFLFLALWMRVVALLISYVAKPNDEAAASLLLGLPRWLLPAISVALLLVLTYLGARKLGATWKVNAACYVLASIATAIVVLSDQALF